MPTNRPNGRPRIPFSVAALMLAACLFIVGACATAGPAVQSSAQVSEESVAAQVAQPRKASAAQSDALQTDDGTLAATGVTIARADAPDIPAYAGVGVIELNGNVPAFTDVEKAYTPFEFYGDLDDLGRCTVAFALVGEETMPTGPRGEIYQVRPTGWQHVEYECVDGGSLYNRTHLIGFLLTAEDANERNLITGTRYMNAESMLPYEEDIARYVENTGNHVLYRVTPVFNEDELVARGVQMEAWSVEDDGEGICFNVFCYNVQPGITIDYATGTSQLAPEEELRMDIAAEGPLTEDRGTYVVNTRSHRFHRLDCVAVSTMSDYNRQVYEGSRQSLINRGYSPCEQCMP